MNNKLKREDRLILNLQDSGCTQEDIEKFMVLYKKGDILTAKNIMTKQRKILLADLHETQNKLDCLDYLLFRLER